MPEKEIYYANGQFIASDTPAVTLKDLSVQRGYGIFDFFRFQNGKPLFLSDHLERLQHSYRTMRLVPNESQDELAQIVESLILRNKLTDGGIRIIMTGGDSMNGYDLGQTQTFATVQPLQPIADSFPGTGIRLLTRNYQRQLPEVKTTDYLMAVWLQPWMKEHNGDDILYHDNGCIRECPRSNFFMFSNKGSLVTPSNGMLKGITRKNTLAVASKLKISIEERDISVDELDHCKGCFITSSTKRLMPVHSIDGKIVSGELLGKIEQIWYELIQLENSFL